MDPIDIRFVVFKSIIGLVIGAIVLITTAHIVIHNQNTLSFSIKNPNRSLTQTIFSPELRLQESSFKGFLVLSITRVFVTKSVSLNQSFTIKRERKRRSRGKEGGGKRERGGERMCVSLKLELAGHKWSFDWRERRKRGGERGYYFVNSE